jgi:integrase
MGLYKQCGHTGRQRERCEHPWWGSFRGRRASLSKWANREIRSKTEALDVLDQLRTAIRSGKFEAQPVAAEKPSASSSALTFRQLAELYKERHVIAKRLARAETIDYQLKPLLNRFGDTPIANIKTADVEDFITDLRNTTSRRNLPLSPASINRAVQLLREMLNWAVGREYLDRTPFRRGTVCLIRPELEDNMRRRRISEAEETSLLAAAPPHLRSMIICAIDTGMRRGEMFAIRWADVDLEQGLITLRGKTTKSGRTRRVPIGTARLRAVLDWLRIDAGGEKKLAEALVFSNEIGEPMGSLRTTWVLTVLRAHGIKPKWCESGYRELQAVFYQRFREINLHWHDFRHEYASRLVERGVPLSQVRDLLGHASITTTERYDNQTIESLQTAVGRLERGQEFDSTSPRAAMTKFHKSFIIASDRAPRSREKERRETTPNSFIDKDLGTWLGDRDSNPDNLLQRQVSYR